jgi:hypothetical protein
MPRVGFEPTIPVFERGTTLHQQLKLYFIYLLVVYLTILLITRSNYTPIVRMIGRLVNSELDRMYCICLEGRRKTTEVLNHDSRSAGRDLNPGRLEYEAGVYLIFRDGKWSIY